MKSLFNVLIIKWIILFMASCTQTEDSSVTKNDQKGFIKIIPKNQHGKDYFPYTMVQRDTKKGGLIVLDKGYDSVFIRIWYVYGFNMQIINLKNTKGEWQGNTIDLTSNDDSTQIINSMPLRPKSGWSHFINELYSLKIVDLPDATELNKYYVDTDPNFVIIEIATKAKYRIYSYAMPYAHLEFPEAVSIENILELIEEELEFKQRQKI